MNTQDAARAFRSRGISRPRGPAPGRNRTYGNWPNQEDVARSTCPWLAAGRSRRLRQLLPEIRFSVGERHDFMDAVASTRYARPEAARMR